MALAIVLRAFPLLLLCLSAPAYSDIFDMSEHSGIIRDSNGNYSQVSANGSVRSLTNSTTLAITEKVNFPTSKGLFSADITRNAVVDLARIGKTVRSVAVATGPVGLTLTAVSLVCELTSICNQAGQWMISPEAAPGSPNSYPSTDGQWWGWGTNYHPTVQAACSDPGRIAAQGGAGFVYDHNEFATADTYRCYIRRLSDGNVFYASNAYKIVGCAPGYTVSGSNCVKDGVVPRPVTNSDWDSKESLLNDQRFIDPLVTGNHPVPIQAPSIQTPIKKPISKETTTIKDGAGNTTGTEETTTEAEISDPSSAENPSNNPNLIKISETTIKNTYNLNNQLTNSTTTVSDGAQKPEPQSIKIEIDDMQDTPLQTYQVPVTFAYDSWGSGSCPADRSVNYHYGSLNLTFQPACDFAVGMQPVILVVAGMIAMFIVSGVRLND